MIHFEPVTDPLAADSVELQSFIINSQPRFNLLVMGKEFLSAAEIREENRSNLEMGEKLLYIKENNQCIGLASYLNPNPNDSYPWIGLLVLHSNYAKQGKGSAAFQLLKQRLQQENAECVRLAVQHGNKAGAAFWTQHGFVRIRSAIDNHNTEVDVYEKQLAVNQQFQL